MPPTYTPFLNLKLPDPVNDPALMSDINANMTLADRATGAFVPETYNLGTDLANLNAAMAAASAVGNGCVVKLTPGKTYTLTARNTAYANVTVIGYGATINGPTAFASGQKWYGVAFTCGDVGDANTVGPNSVRNVDGFTCEDCTFTYTGTNAVNNGLGLLHTDDASSQNVRLTRCKFSCVGGGWMNGIAAICKNTYTVANWRVRDCHFENIGRIGVEFVGQAGTLRNIRILDNTFKVTGTGTAIGTIGQGISVTGVATLVVIDDNYLESTAGYSIEIVDGVTNFLVTLNTIVSPATRPISSSGATSSFGLIANNTIKGSAQSPTLAALFNVAIADNTFESGKLFLDTCGECTVVGNTIVTGSDTVLTLNGCDKCVVNSNYLESTNGAAVAGIQIVNTSNTKIGVNKIVRLAGSDHLVSGTTTGTTILPQDGQAAVTGAGPSAGLDSWTTYAPTWGGFSVAPTATARYVVDGKRVTVKVITSGLGTSNGTTLTMSLPVAAREVQYGATLGVGTDNGVALTTGARVDIDAGLTQLNIYKDPSGAAWTNAGSKGVHFTLVYESA